MGLSRIFWEQSNVEEALDSTFSIPICSSWFPTSSFYLQSHSCDTPLRPNTKNMSILNDLHKDSFWFRSKSDERTGFIIFPACIFTFWFFGESKIEPLLQNYLITTMVFAFPRMILSPPLLQRNTSGLVDCWCRLPSHRSSAGPPNQQALHHWDP